MVSGGATEHRVSAIHSAWSAAGGSAAVHRLPGSSDYAELLEAVLEAQPDVVLVVGAQGDDVLIRQVADVVWKFDSRCAVAVDAGPVFVDGVIVADGAAESTAGVLRAVVAGPGTAAAPQVAAPAALAAAESSASRELLPSARTAAAMTASVGWADVAADLLPPGAAGRIDAAVNADERSGLAFTDPDGYRHWVAVPRDVPDLLSMLEDERLSALATEVMGSPDIWLGSFDVLAAEAGAGWRRDCAEVLTASVRSTFRPCLSVYVPVDDGVVAEIQGGSHRLRGGHPAASGLVAPAQVALTLGHAVLIIGGCWHRLGGGRVLRLRFIRGWMKPDVLLVHALGDQAGQLGPQGRRWCGADIGMPASVGEFLAVEEASTVGALSRRKGSGI
jgi:hypothetical protein